MRDHIFTLFTLPTYLFLSRSVFFLFHYYYSRIFFLLFLINWSVPLNITLVASLFRLFFPRFFSAVFCGSARSREQNKRSPAITFLWPDHDSVQSEYPISSLNHLESPFGKYQHIGILKCSGNLFPCKKCL